MAEIYARKADLKDDRVKDMAFTEATFTYKAYTESISTVQYSPTKVGSTPVQATASTTLRPVKEFTEEEYRLMKEEAAAKEAASVDDEAAAAEIIKDISTDKELEKVDTKLKVKKYFKSSREHFIASFRLRFFEKSEDPAVQAELDRRILRDKATTVNLQTKFSTTASYADRLLKSTDITAKEMQAPVQKTDKKYADL
jgi:hypothetical protein